MSQRVVFSSANNSKLACTKLRAGHNQYMKTYVGIVLALAFCASAFADPSKNVVVQPTQQMAYPKVVKICYIKTIASGIPQRCDRFAGFPTTSSPLQIIGRE